MSAARDNPRDVIRASLKASVRTSGGGGGEEADVVTSAAKLFHLEAANYANGATWPDSGPNGYTFTKSGTITKTASWTNGLPAVSFPGGADTYFEATGVKAVGTDSGTGFAVFYVGVFDVPSSAMYLGPATGASAAYTNPWLLAPNGDHVFGQQGPDIYFSSADQIGVGELFVVGMTYPASKSSTRTYSRAMGSNETIDDSADRTLDNPGIMTVWYIGHTPFSGLPTMDGHLAEVVVYEDDIPRAEMEAKVAQLAAKYAILGA